MSGQTSKSVDIWRSYGWPKSNFSQNFDYFLIFSDFDFVFYIKTTKKGQVLCIHFKVCLISNIFCPQTLPEQHTKFS